MKRLILVTIIALSAFAVGAAPAHASITTGGGGGGITFSPSCMNLQYAYPSNPCTVASSGTIMFGGIPLSYGFGASFLPSSPCAVGTVCFPSEPCYTGSASLNVTYGATTLLNAAAGGTLCAANSTMSSGTIALAVTNPTTGACTEYMGSWLGNRLTWHPPEPCLT
jgi:hypothetical protein